MPNNSPTLHPLWIINKKFSPLSTKRQGSGLCHSRRVSRWLQVASLLSSWINTSSRAVVNANSSTSTAPPTTAPSVPQPKNSTVAASGPSTKSAPPSARTSSPPTSNPNSPGSSSKRRIANVMPLCYPLPHTSGKF